MLTVLSPGVGLVNGKLDNWERTSTVTAVDTTTDPMGVNVINLSRVLPDGRVLPLQTLNEGQVYVIGGLPYPLNLLNDGWLYFPTGSLHEDITIHIKLLDFANVGADTVTIAEGIINAADFDVFVSDSLMEPSLVVGNPSLLYLERKGAIRRSMVTSEIDNNRRPLI